MARTVILTRPAGAYDNGIRLARLIEALGYSVYSLPILQIRRLDLHKEELGVLDRLVRGEFTWICFLSPTAVYVTREAFDTLSLPPLERLSVKIGVQGPGTAGAVLECSGRSVDFVPSVYMAEDFARELAPILTRDDRVLVPQSSDGRDVFVPALTRGGFEAVAVNLYETAVVTPSAGELGFVRQQNDAIIVFMSPSAVKAAVSACDREWLSRQRILSIGPITSRAVRDCGLIVWREAGEHSEKGIVEALRDSGT